MKQSRIQAQGKRGNKQQCWALTKQVRRCTRRFDHGWLFCPTHRWSGWIQLVTVITVVLTGLADITQITGNPFFAVRTPTALPRVDKLYYVFMVDASSRMSAIFDGDKTKWDTAREAALNNLLYGLPTNANYGLIVLGGTNGQDVATCDSVTMAAPFAPGNRDTVGNIIKAQRADGVAPIAKAFDLARDQLLGLPDDQTATNFELFVFLGGGDTCSDNDLRPLLFFLQNSAKYLTNTHVDIFLLSNENIERQILLEIEQSNKEIDNVEVKITTNRVDLEEAVNQSLLAAQERAQRMGPTAIATPTVNFIQNITATAGILTLTPSETATPSPIPDTLTSTVTFTSSPSPTITASTTLTPTWTFLPSLTTTETSRPPSPSITIETPTFCIVGLLVMCLLIGFLFVLILVFNQSDD